MKPLSAGQAYTRAAALCSGSEQCAFDLERKLERWGLDRGERESVLRRLRAEGFLDDVRYCRAFVHDKLLFNSWGRQKMACALHARHLDAGAVSEALGAIDGNEYEEVLNRFMLGRLKRFPSTLSSFEQSRKLYAAAAAHGFESAVVSRWLSRHRLDAFEDE